MYLYRENSSGYSTEERWKQNKDLRIFFKDIKSPVQKSDFQLFFLYIKKKK